MTDKVQGYAEGYLEVGINASFEVVINHPDLNPDENGVGHIVFSPIQARKFAEAILKQANQAEGEAWKQKEEARRAAAAAIPVDRSARTLLDGQPVTDDHRQIDPATGMQKSYVVLSEAERAKGFVRPVRSSYIHLPCGALTTMGTALAQTYARDPGFYSGTFCCRCANHFPLVEFVWEGTNERVGS